MKQSNASFSVRPRFLSLAAAGLLGLGAAAEGAGEYAHLTGIVRDFRTAHPDFNVIPAGGPGHDAGNVAMTLGPEGRPVYNGPGFRVDTQWRDSGSNPIAPHLFGGWGAGAVLVADAPVIDAGATLDTWDSSVGPYGGANIGPAPSVVVGATMPTITVPAIGPNVGDLSYEGSGTSVLAADLHCDLLVIADEHTLEIDGSVTIVCEANFEMRDTAAIRLLPGARVELYVRGDISIRDSTVIDGFHDPSRFMIFHLGNGTVRIADGSQVYGSIISPAGTLTMPDDADFYGVVIAADIDVADAAGLHIDFRSPFDQCGNLIADTAGVAGPASSGGISSAATFDEWFHDIPGTNISRRHVITLVKGGDDVYAFTTNNFFPLDDRLFGNESDPHNYHFTYTFEAEFTYDACAGQFFEFEGNDDVWVFVDGKLAMDLGGIDADTGQIIDFDRLGLVPGETHEVLFLYAHRRGPLAEFRIRTNVGLSTQNFPYAISAMFD